MLVRFKSFKEFFRGYEEQYVIIGGTACTFLMDERGFEFRATKDVDLVLIVEALTPEFSKRFWEYVQIAGYEHQDKSNNRPQFYRFSHPVSSEYPFMLELFTRNIDGIVLPSDAVLTHLPKHEDISSLSAILLDEDYYEILQKGKVDLDGVPVLGVESMILFKAKAWLDLSARKQAGESVDSKDIRKHKNDVLRLSVLLEQTTRIVPPSRIKEDMRQFLLALKMTDINTKQLQLTRSKDEIIAILARVYGIDLKE